MKLANNWEEYKILDMASGKKLEQWGKYILERPDPQIIWKEKTHPKQWEKINARYIRSSSGGGYWENSVNNFIINYKDLKFNIKLMGFKHTRLFPEQAYNWDYIMQTIKQEKQRREKQNIDEPIKVLNLFAYTGGATVASAVSGAEVVHVDSSKGATTMARENVELNKKDAKVRYIIDDVLKFMRREIRRGNHYDAIIMDPPSYGRRPNGEVWRFEENINELLDLTKDLLSKNPLFVIVNSYTTGFSPVILETIMKQKFKNIPNSKIFADELGIPTSDKKMILPCGITGHLEVEYANN